MFLDGVLFLWFMLTILGAAWTLYDLLTRQPEIMGVMKLAWVLITLFYGPLGVFLYFVSCREAVTGTHEQFVAPQWKQALGSAVHCVSGDALGIVLMAFVTALLNLPMVVDFPLEYLSGFMFGWLIFQAQPIMKFEGLPLPIALKQALLPEFISLSFHMTGMFPAMALLMMRVPGGMDPRTLAFWGVMSLSIAVGSIFTYIANWFLTQWGIKHGMGSVSAMGKGGHSLQSEAQLSQAQAAHGAMSAPQSAV